MPSHLVPILDGEPLPSAGPDTTHQLSQLHLVPRPSFTQVTPLDILCHLVIQSEPYPDVVRQSDKMPCTRSIPTV
jgi:hypothetical protein